MSTSPRRAILTGVLPVLALGLVAWPASAVHTARAATAAPIPVVAVDGYKVSVFARGTQAYSGPDSIINDGQHVFVRYQNVTAKDGTDGRTSTIVEYDATGKVLRTIPLLGHCDGLRQDPATHKLWALSNEDGNPRLLIVDPATGSATPYAFPPVPHGGGFDDIGFTGGMVFMTASNPNTNKAGVNVYPALDKVTLAAGKVKLTPVLMGDAMATDLTSSTNAKVQLNLIDPDSITFDPEGNLVLDNQGGSQLVFINKPGTPQQYVTALPIGNQVDDTVWPSSTAGQLLVSDTSANTIYSLRTTFVPGVSYSSTPNDSGVAGIVGTIDPATGIVTPVAIGFGSPHGITYVPDAKR